MPEAKFKVTRNCCTSGNCIKCITARRSDLTLKPFQCIRVTQLDNLTREKAEIVARNFKGYQPEILNQQPAT